MSITSRSSSKLPNMDKLFVYLGKEQWQNVSANFSGFVRKEFESTMRQLEEDEENFKNLRMMIEYAEVGRYNDAKALLDPAHKEFMEMDAMLTDKNIFKHKSKPSPRNQGGGNPIAYEDKRDVYSPAKRATPSPRYNNTNYGKGRDTYTPNKRESLPGTPKRPESEGYGDRRDIYSPGKRDMITTPKRDGLTPNINARQDGYSPRRYHDKDISPSGQNFSPGNSAEPRHTGEIFQIPWEESERGPRTPQKNTNQSNAYDDPHRLNFDSLRLKSPDKGKGESPRMTTPNDREHSGKSDHRSHVGPTGFDQFASSKTVWGRNDNEKPKLEYSTYKQEFPEHPVESYGRQDKNRYRENFGSATEKDYMQYPDSKPDYRDEFRDTILVGNNDVRIQIQSKRERLHRLQETPENDKKPSDLARRFKEIYMGEWTDAYDEIVKDFGAEKTVRHLLWIVTVRLDGKEAWLIALEVGDKQLRDLEKSTYSIMSRPGSEHHQSHVHSRDLGESLPTSRNLLLKYRKQTAALSVPFVKEECRDRICRTLLESSGFPKMYLTDASRVVAYILKCAEIVWLMSVQDPPIVLEYITKDTEGARFNSEHYQTYTSPGSIYKYGVWPLLRLDKRGPIIAKGLAQGVQ